MLLTTKQFIAQIDRFLKDTGMSERAFGRACCDNWKFLHRLRETGRVDLDRVHVVKKYMSEERERRRAKAREARKTAAE